MADPTPESLGYLAAVGTKRRDRRGLPWLEDLLQDFRFGARMLRKHPGFTAITVATVAVGIGATTAIFSIVNGVVLRPLPYPDSGRLVAIYETQLPKVPQLQVAPKSFLEWKRQGTTLQYSALNQNMPFVMTGAGEAVRRFGFMVTAEYFAVMGVQPILGRTFDENDASAGRNDLAVLNYKSWVSLFNSDPAVIGRKIRLNNQLFTVIGVMPQSFLPEIMTDPWLFVPMAIGPRLAEDYQAHWFRGIGRIKPGVTLEQASSELNLIAQRLGELSPETNKGLGVSLVPMLENQVGNVRPLLLTLLGAVGVLLMIACVNVANLLLARAGSRAREIAVRSALGASRGRIIRQLLCESLLISLAGSALGIALAFVSKDFLLGFAPIGLPRAAEVAIDGWALLFTCVLSAVTGLGFGFVPALQASRVNLPAAMKDGGRGASDGRARMRLRSVLIVAEVALALVLLFNASLLIRSFNRLRQVEMGFEVGRKVTYSTSFILTSGDYATPEKLVTFSDRIIAQFSRIPGIKAVTLASAHPMFFRSRRGIFIEGRPHLQPTDALPANHYVVTPAYFEIFRIRLQRGRLFDEHDRADSNAVAIVSQGFARKYFPDGNAAGQRIQLLGRGETQWREVVGVVNDVREEGPAVASMEQVYEPFAQRPTNRANLIFRLDHPIAGLRSTLRAALDAVDPDLPFSDMKESMDFFWNSTIGNERFALFLFSVFSGIALLLCSMGIYGVVSYSVTQRTQEIGIRMALGAQVRDVLMLVFTQTGRMVGLGLVIGLVGAFASTALIAKLLYEVSPHDPMTFLAVPAVLAAVAFVACAIPARRAAQVSPVAALRCD
ncbi:MAG: hypothetical protein JWM32_1029 [Verrucomicrobia bacterium]|nr:hypothetical protein [Verrucomicrobiota bacterium]